MKSTKSQQNKYLWSAVLHALEFFAVIGGAYLIMHLFDPDPASKAIVLGTVIAFFVKYARVNPKIPVKDYTNPKFK